MRRPQHGRGLSSLFEMNSPITKPPPLRGGDERLWIVLSHLSLFFGVGILLPLVVYLVKKEESAAVAFHAREALNFHISIFIYVLACIPLLMIVVGFPLLIVLGVGSPILSIVGAVRGSSGEVFRYPLTIRLV